MNWGKIASNFIFAAAASWFAANVAGAGFESITTALITAVFVGLVSAVKEAADECEPPAGGSAIAKVQAVTMHLVPF